MTVTANTPVSGPHVADGVNRDWQFDWKIDNVAHMALRITDADGSNEQIVLSGFTILPAYLDNNAGGFVNYPTSPTVPLVAGKLVYPYRVVPYEQPTQIGNQGGFFPRTHERAFDYIAMQAQQLDERLSRALSSPVGVAGYVLPLALAGAVIGWNAAGTALENKALLDLGAAVVIDDATLTGNSHVNVPTQFSVKSYVDVETAARIAAVNAEAATRLANDNAEALARANADTALSTTITNLGLPAGVASTFLQRNAGNTAYVALPVADTRLSLTAPIYCTLAQLVALDTSKDTVAIVADSSAPDDIFKWVSGDQSARTIAQSLTSTLVVAATDIITKAAHGMFTGSAVVVTSAVNGLALNTVYWVRKIDVDTFTFHATVEDALANTAKVDLTGSTNFTMKQLVDPLQDVYVIKTGGQLDGSAGVWMRVKGSRSLGIGRARYQRFNDTVLVGTGATGMFRDHSGTTAITAAGSWLIDEKGAGSAFDMGYLAGAAIVSMPGYYSGAPNSGVAGIVRTPDGASSSNVWGVAAYASGHATSGGSIAWAAYMEAAKTALSNTTTEAIEFEITNHNSTPTTFVHPESTYVQGRTIGILLGSGGGNAAPYDADVGFMWVANGAKFRSGMVFRTGSLTLDGGTNYQHAILLPTKARVEWYSSDLTGNVALAIHSEISTAAKAQFIRAIDDNLMFNNANGGLYARFVTNTAAAGNYPYMTAGGVGVNPIYGVEGGDANLDVVLRGKGTGGGKAQDGAAASKILWNTTGVAFNGTAPVAKGTVGAALSTGGAETNVNIATRINELRTVLINCGLTA